MFKFFKKNKQQTSSDIEDFTNLIRVYFQACIADKLGISNLSVLPDLRLFKQTLKIQTTNNRIGVAEKKACQNLLKTQYKLSTLFFSEIDGSIKKNCRNMQNMQEYLYRFQGFTQGLITFVSTEVSWKIRIPSFFNSTLKSIIYNSVNKLYTKENWKDISLIHSASNLRNQSKQLNFSKEWSSEYVYNIIILAKKTKQKNND